MKQKPKHDIWSGSIIEHYDVTSPFEKTASEVAREAAVAARLEDAETKRISLRKSMKTEYTAEKDCYLKAHSTRELKRLEDQIVACVPYTSLMSKEFGFCRVSYIGEGEIRVRSTEDSPKSKAYSFPEAFYLGELWFLDPEEARRYEIRSRTKSTKPRNDANKVFRDAVKKKAQKQAKSRSKDPETEQKITAIVNTIMTDERSGKRSRMVIRNGRIVCKKCGYEVKPGSGILFCPVCDQKDGKKPVPVSKKDDGLLVDEPESSIDLQQQ